MAGEGLKQSKDVLPDGKRYTPQPRTHKEPDFNKAMNPPNNPTKNRQPENITPGNKEYPNYGEPGNPIVGPN